MKRILKRMSICLALCLCMVAPQFARAAEPVQASLWRSQVWVNGTSAGFLNETGGKVYPLVYQGTTYIPIRSVGEWMGSAVGWNGDTQTVTLTSGKATAVIHKASDAPSLTKEEMAVLQARFQNGVTAQLSQDIGVDIDGKRQSFVNVKGEPVYPITFEGSVYLPLRSIGELTGKAVLYFTHEGAVPEIRIYDPLTAAQADGIRAFFKTQSTLTAELSAAVDQLLATTEKAAAQTQLGVVRGLLEQLQKTPSPGVPVAEDRVGAIALEAAQIATGAAEPYQRYLNEDGVTVANTQTKALFDTKLSNLEKDMAYSKDYMTALCVSF